MYWEKDRETMSVSELQALQMQRLHRTIRRAITSPYYQEFYHKHGIVGPDVAYGCF